MTYRELYQRLHPEEDVINVPLKYCPDLATGGITGFQCPALPGVDGPEICYDCWDSEVPDTKEAEI